MEHSSERPTGSSRAGLAGFRIWLDVENPPQVQYLLPLADSFREKGAELVVTARDYGITFELLDRRGVEYIPAGSHFGPSKTAKVVGNMRRALDLRRMLVRTGRPDGVVSASRSAAIAARALRIPSFALCDYEYVNLYVFKLTGSFVVHPDAISEEAFRARGIAPRRLIPYRGIKEDITFTGVDTDNVPAHVFPELAETQRTRVLVRPPAEESHYHRQESSELAHGLLSRLARRDDAVVVFSPRYPWQIDALQAHEWQAQPVVVRESVPFVSLYKAVDVVVSGGGTMTREAAYLGIPAVSMFQGAIGGVDRYLETTGRLTILRDPAELDSVDLGALHRRPVLNTNPQACDDIVRAVAEIARRRR